MIKTSKKAIECYNLTEAIDMLCQSVLYRC